MSDLVKVELRTRLFPPISGGVTAEDVVNPLLDRALGPDQDPGADPSSPLPIHPRPIPSLALFVLQPRFVIKSPVGDLDESPAGDPGNTWWFWLPLLALLLVLGIGRLVQILVGR